MDTRLQKALQKIDSLSKAAKCSTQVTLEGTKLTLENLSAKSEAAVWKELHQAEGIEYLFNYRIRLLAHAVREIDDVRFNPNEFINYVEAEGAEGEDITIREFLEKKFSNCTGPVINWLFKKYVDMMANAKESMPEEFKSEFEFAFENMMEISERIDSALPEEEKESDKIVDEDNKLTTLKEEDSHGTGSDTGGNKPDSDEGANRED